MYFMLKKLFIKDNLSGLEISQGSYFNEINEKIEIFNFSCNKVGFFLQLYSVIIVKDNIVTDSTIPFIIILA